MALVHGPIFCHGRERFGEADCSGRTHILHVVEWEGFAWRQKLAFRNALRESPSLAREYDALKLTLSQEFAGDRAAYTAGKTDFVRRVVAAQDPHSPFLTRD